MYYCLSINAETDTEDTLKMSWTTQPPAFDITYNFTHPHVVCRHRKHWYKGLTLIKCTQISARLWYVLNQNKHQCFLQFTFKLNSQQVVSMLLFRRYKEKRISNYLTWIRSFWPKFFMIHWWKSKEYYDVVESKWSFDFYI